MEGVVIHRDFAHNNKCLEHNHYHVSEMTYTKNLMSIVRSHKFSTTGRHSTILNETPQTLLSVLGCVYVCMCMCAYKVINIFAHLTLDICIINPTRRKKYDKKCSMSTTRIGFFIKRNVAHALLNVKALKLLVNRCSTTRTNTK